MFLHYPFLPRSPCVVYTFSPFRDNHVSVSFGVTPPLLRRSSHEETFVMLAQLCTIISPFKFEAQTVLPHAHTYQPC